MRSIRSVRLCLLAIVVAACHSQPPPPLLGPAPQFELVNRNGAIVTTKSFAGRPWVVDFIFTRCPAICPMMTTAMSTIEQRTAEQQIRLASITLDPVYDTAEMLDEFATRHGAGSRWSFLRPRTEDGPQAEAEAHAISRSFALGSEPATAETPLIHSTRIVLLDANQQIRGYYDALDSTEIERLLDDLEVLEK